MLHTSPSKALVSQKPLCFIYKNIRRVFNILYEQILISVYKLSNAKLKSRKPYKF